MNFCWDVEKITQSSGVNALNLGKKKKEKRLLKNTKRHLTGKIGASVRETHTFHISSPWYPFSDFPEYVRTCKNSPCTK